MNKTRVLVEIAIMVAMAFVLEVVFTAFPNMPFGGRVSLSLLPIIVLSWRQGIVPGIIGGVIFSILNMLLDGFGPAAWGLTYTIFIAAMFLDYLFAFGIVGLAGLVKRFLGNNVYTFAIGIAFGAFLRFLMHFISGMVLWSEFAPEGQSPALYSFIYNGTYMLPTTILLLVVGVLMYLPMKEQLSIEEIY